MCLCGRTEGLCKKLQMNWDSVTSSLEIGRTGIIVKIETYARALYPNPKDDQERMVSHPGRMYRRNSSDSGWKTSL